MKGMKQKTSKTAAERANQRSKGVTWRGATITAGALHTSHTRHAQVRLWFQIVHT